MSDNKIFRAFPDVFATRNKKTKTGETIVFIYDMIFYILSQTAHLTLMKTSRGMAKERVQTIPPSKNPYGHLTLHFKNLKTEEISKHLSSTS